MPPKATYSVFTHPVFQPGIDRANAAMAAAMRRAGTNKARANVVDWADKHRLLSKVASAEAGQWRTKRVPYSREPMLCLSDPRVRDVVLMWASQTSKTEIGINWYLRNIAVNPGPMLWVTSTDNSVTKVSRNRFDPALEIDYFKEIVAPKTAGGSAGKERTTKCIKFENGILNFATAGSPSDLASDPIRDVTFDEIDRYDDSAMDEGDPIGLGRARQTTFNEYGAKTLYISSPAILETSRINKLFESSDKRYYFVPCHACGTEQKLEWEQVKFPDGPQAAYYECCVSSCRAHWSDTQRWKAVRKGRWIASKPFNGRAGFHISQIYSTFVRLETLAKWWEDTSGKPTERQVFWNTALSLPWSMDALKPPAVDAIPREDWDGYHFPVNACAIVAFADVQGNRIEVTTAAVDPDETFYFIDHTVITGQTSMDQVWNDFDDHLALLYKREDGRIMEVTAFGIDCGYEFERVCRFAKEQRRKGRRCYAIKGKSEGFASPVIGNRKARIDKSNRYRFYWANTDKSKYEVLQKFQLESGPGRLRFPDRECFSDRYFQQLTSEKVVTRYRKGYPVHEWRITPGARNEALDCAAGMLGVLRWLNPNLKALALRNEVVPGFTVEEEAAEEVEEADEKEVTEFDGRLTAQDELPSGEPAPPKGPRLQRLGHSVPSSESGKIAPTAPRKKRKGPRRVIVNSGGWE